MAESNQTAKLPSGEDWVYLPELTHGTKRKMDKVGTSAAFASLKEFERMGVDLTEIAGKLDLEKAAASRGTTTLSPEQEDYLVVAQSVSVGGKPISGTDELSERDFRFMIETLRMEYALDKQEDRNQGKERSEPPSSIQDSSMGATWQEDGAPSSIFSPTAP